jgi:hypothetical protein
MLWKVQVVVHRIFSSCSKRESLLLQAGDSLLSAGEVSASASGWDQQALSKLLRVLMDDTSKLGCVFRRPERPPGKRKGYVWYASGASGCMSTQGGALGMLAEHSVLVIPQADTSRPTGKQLRICFHHLRHGEVCKPTSFLAVATTSRLLSLLHCRMSLILR